MVVPPLQPRRVLPASTLASYMASGQGRTARKKCWPCCTLPQATCGGKTYLSLGTHLCPPYLLSQTTPARMRQRGRASHTAGRQQAVRR